MSSNSKLIELSNDNQELFWNIFNDISSNCSNTNPIYSREFYLYQKEYCKSNKTYISDKSFIIVNDDIPVSAAIFILCKGLETNFKEVSFGLNFPGILIISNQITNKSLNLLIERINVLLDTSKKIIFTIPQSNCLNKGYDFVLNRFKFSQSINWTKSVFTSKNIDLLWSDVRKSYKSPINKGLREQIFKIIDSENLSYESFQSIQKFHYEIAGRKTRSSKTWSLQYDLIKKDKGFAILSFEKNSNNLNSAIYFYKSNNHAFYGTGIFNSYSKKKLYGYSLIWKAILYCKLKNITNCELDENIKFKFQNEIDKKSKDISFFKAGFGGVLIPRLIFKLHN